MNNNHRPIQDHDNAPSAGLEVDTSPTTGSPPVPDDRGVSPTDAIDGDGRTAGPSVVITKVHDPDAGVGCKTRKDGKPESFYGYQEHTLVRVPQGDSEADTEPRLITRFELTPASTDVVDVSLSLLDRLPNPAETLIADRHYSYKTADRWRDELADRGIDQVLDLRADEHGFTDKDHIRWAAAWPHCPRTPDAYGIIERPPPGTADDAKAKMAIFNERIEKRFAFAFRRVTTPDSRGVARWECPAFGKVGCERQEGTVEAAVQLGLPIVQNPPDPASADFPLCCKQRTVTLDPGPLRKLMQNEYWGLKAWVKEWNKRTYVEGSYGNRKNASTENLRRGHFRVTGLAMVHITTAMAAAAYNIRMLRNWNGRTGLGDPDHPLLQPADESFGYVRLTKEESEKYCAEQLRCEAERSSATQGEN